MVKNKSQIKNIISQYKSELKKNQINPSKIILYGSYAYGQPNQWSDIDIAIIAKDFGPRSTIERMEFLAQKAAKIDDSLEVLGFTANEFQKSKNGIFRQILAQGQEF